MTVQSNTLFGSSNCNSRDSQASAARLSANGTVSQTEGKEEDPTVVNAKIEAQLKRDTETFRREESRLLRVLLLGQAGSDFRMKYARSEWEQERLGWRAIIQLNIVRQILSIVQIVQSEIDGTGSDSVQSGSRPAPAPPPDRNPAVQRFNFNENHQHLILRLGSRLSEVEQELKRRLVHHEICYPAMTSPLMSATPFGPEEKLDDDVLIRKKVIEYSVRTWRDILEAAPFSHLDHSTAVDGSDSPSASPTLSFPDMPTQTIADLREEIRALWADGEVRVAVKQRRSEIPDSVGIDSDGESCFLDEIDRLAQEDYQVSDQDIVRARLKTVGIQEYKLTLDSGPGGKRWSWRIYDVGGCRTMRKAWLPYFDNIQVIIFLAPVSVFDERLEEDPRVNRLEDSIVLWSCICETPLLAKSQFILFLNKCDLLQRKLSRGKRLVDYLSSYGKRGNDAKSVIKYMREQFKTIHREKSPADRMLYIYPTTVTDPVSTAVTLEAIRDLVVRQHLASTQLM
ncbi:G-alpha-domain-containing protein [Macrolepiota fuliginosa MF-IS2]|uniref:G-alpha-domain-containing protein n=1 Tax=Macrolepiota fuliginosa MF-IS2 TaxID=1400762 RepID=A0A9P5XH09_9AGAR|nr:G-alpha-domain-containing protein [Macrolepiota fuliginosa MF-IS2]